MTEPPPEESNQTSGNETTERGVRKKIVVSKSSVSGVSRAQKPPVVVRKSKTSVKTTPRLKRAVPRKSVTVATNPDQAKVLRKPVKRLGQPDFSSSIIAHEPSEGRTRRHKSSSLQQRLFFDAAIAVVTLSFMVLTLLHF